MNQRVIDRLIPLFESAVEKYQMGEEIMWDITLGGSDQGAIMVTSLWIKGTILGTHINYTFVTNPIALLDNQEIVDQMIFEAVETAKAQRAEFAAQAMREAGEANGEAPLNIHQLAPDHDHPHPH